MAENTQGTIYTARATGGTGTVTFSIAGGADAAFFAIGSGGALSFAQAPNYDLEADADADNLYQVIIQAQSGTRTATLALSVQVTNLREGIKVTRIATGIADPVSIAHTNVANQLILGRGDGAIFLVNGTTGARTAIAYAPLPGGFELIDAAFGPDNAFYRGPILLFRGAAGIFAYRPNVGSFIDKSLANGTTADTIGSLYFAAGGQLFAATGDPAKIQANGFGSFFVEGDPYAGASLRAIAFDAVGRGLRAPAGFAEVGDLLIMIDRGGAEEHEFSLFRPAQRPIDFGWPFFEGTAQLQANPPQPMIGPALVYPYGNGKREGLGPVGGVVYQGTIAGIAGHFVFADEDGTVWSIPVSRLTDGLLHRVDDLERRTEDFLPDAGTLDQIVDIAADAGGRIYILDADGELFRVDPS